MLPKLIMSHCEGIAPCLTMYVDIRALFYVETKSGLSPQQTKHDASNRNESAFNSGGGELKFWPAHLQS
jgi:hypothetical protein